MLNFSITDMLMTLPGIIIGLTVHEFAHALMAFKLGDRTASDQGRLTLNPIKHIDPVGFLMLMVLQFGWAKPVSFNPEAFSKPKRDEILVALAGPFSNLIMAFLLFGVFKLMYVATGGQGDGVMGIVAKLVLTSGAINLGLFVFNLIPIPPLDGSHIYMAFLKERASGPAFYLQRYGIMILLVVILVQNNLGIDLLPIGPIVGKIASVMFMSLGL